MSCFAMSQQADKAKDKSEDVADEAGGFFSNLFGSADHAKDDGEFSSLVAPVKIACAQSLSSQRLLTTCVMLAVVLSVTTQPSTLPRTQPTTPSPRLSLLARTQATLLMT
jgi:hypothetical protein